MQSILKPGQRSSVKLAAIVMEDTVRVMVASLKLLAMRSVGMGQLTGMTVADSTLDTADATTTCSTMLAVLEKLSQQGTKHLHVPQLWVS